MAHIYRNTQEEHRLCLFAIHSPCCWHRDTCSKLEDGL